jgi:hypothetical protein
MLHVAEGVLRRPGGREGAHGQHSHRGMPGFSNDKSNRPSEGLRGRAAGEEQDRSPLWRVGEPSLSRTGASCNNPVEIAQGRVGMPRISSPARIGDGRLRVEMEAWQGPVTRYDRFGPEGRQTHRLTFEMPCRTEFAQCL